MAGPNRGPKLSVQECRDAIALMRAWLTQQAETIDPPDLGPEYQNTPLPERRERMLAEMLRLFRENETERPMGTHKGTVITMERMTEVLVARRAGRALERGRRDLIAADVQGSLRMTLTQAQREAIEEFEFEPGDDAVTAGMRLVCELRRLQPRGAFSGSPVSLRTLQNTMASMHPPRKARHVRPAPVPSAKRKTRGDDAAEVIASTRRKREESLAKHERARKAAAAAFKARRSR